MTGEFLGKFMCISIAGLAWWQTKSIVWVLTCVVIFTVGWCVMNWNNEEFWND